MAAIVISAGALAVAIVSALIARQQSIQARRANELPAIIDLFAEYRSVEMVQARRLVHERLAGRPEPVPLHELPAEEVEAATRVSHYLDHLGVLVTLGLLKADVVSSFIGRSVEQMWEDMKGYIELERENREHGLYLNHFQYLVEEIDISLQRVA